jgi:hypothetical protein
LTNSVYDTAGQTLFSSGFQASSQKKIPFISKKLSEKKRFLSDGKGVGPPSVINGMRVA